MFDAFSIGPFIFWTHLLFLLLGIYFSSEFFFRLAARANLPLQHFRNFSLYYCCAFLLGGRVLAMLTEYKVYLRDPFRSLILWDGNFSFLGAAVGIAVVLTIVTRGQRATFLQWLDVLLPATALGLAFDWLGKFASGIAYGKPTDVFWGITYEAVHVRYAVPVHPVQLYYALFYLVLTFLLLIIRKRTRRAGAETVLGIVLAAIATMLFEFFRGDFGIPVFATFPDFLVIALLFLSLGILVLIEKRMTQSAMVLYGGFLFVLTLGYAVLRTFLPFASFELRFSQLLAVLALLATVTYVVVHRRWYPHL